MERFIGTGLILLLDRTLFCDTTDAVDEFFCSTLGTAVKDLLVIEEFLPALLAFCELSERLHLLTLGLLGHLSSDIFLVTELALTSVVNLGWYVPGAGIEIS